jgi:CubicO group peptidase (beta-lactamase class C family)
MDELIQCWVNEGELSGAVTLIARRGGIAHFKAYGYRELAPQTPMETNSLFRIFSMTKPITCAALLILVEDGKVLLTDPVSKYLPEFENMRVLIGEEDGRIMTEPAASAMTIQQLATHTSGIGYDIPDSISPTLAQQFRDANVFDPNKTLKDSIETLASFPLLHQPGTTWKYSASIDVLARVIESVSGQSFGEFLKERLFVPLKMTDTAHAVPEEDWDRVAGVYTIPASSEDSQLQRRMGQEDYYRMGTSEGGGSGLMSSVMDYARFAQMLLNGGELEGVRILSPQSIERMSTNLIRDEKNDTSWFNNRAQGFGLGVSVVKDVATLDSLSSVGTWGWSGYASTYFFIDPEKELVAVFMAQYVPTNSKQWWQKFTNLVYQSMVD